MKIFPEGALVQPAGTLKYLKQGFPGVKFPDDDAILTVRRTVMNPNGVQYLYFHEGYFGAKGYLISSMFNMVQKPMSAEHINNLINF